MIEIIKRGTKKQCTCYNCGALLSYDDSDVRSNIIRYSKKQGSKYIKCPQCRKRILIEHTDDYVDGDSV